MVTLDWVRIYYRIKSPDMTRNNTLGRNSNYKGRRAQDLDESK